MDYSFQLFLKFTFQRVELSRQYKDVDWHDRSLNSNVIDIAFDKSVDKAYRHFYCFEHNIIMILFAKRFCCYLFAYKFCGQAKISVHGRKGCTDSQGLTPKNP